VCESKALLLDDDLNAGQPFAKPSLRVGVWGSGFWVLWAIADQYIVQNLYYPK